MTAKSKERPGVLWTVNLRPRQARAKHKAAKLVVYPRAALDEAALNVSGFLEEPGPAEEEPHPPLLVVESQERLKYLPSQTLGSEVKVWGKEGIEFSGKG